MGIGGIMKAKKILLVASGRQSRSSKRYDRRKYYNNVTRITLQLHHDVTVIVDERRKLLRK